MCKATSVTNAREEQLEQSLVVYNTATVAFNLTLPNITLSQFTDSKFGRLPEVIRYYSLASLHTFLLVYRAIQPKFNEK